MHSLYRHLICFYLESLICMPRMQHHASAIATSSLAAPVGQLLLLALRQDKSDADLLQLALFLLLHLLPASPASDASPVSAAAAALARGLLEDGASAPSSTASAMSGGTGHVATLLEALKHTSPAVRMQAVQVLTALTRADRKATEAALRACRGALGRVVEVLDDADQDVLAEALLLLRALTATNADIRSLVAFQVRATARPHSQAATTLTGCTL